jgi:UPF0755 protein
MSPGADWHDPFASDEEALARERRRAEREARRRNSRRSVAEKVQQSGTEAPVATPPPRPPAPPAGAEAREAAAAPTRVRLAPADGDGALPPPASGRGGPPHRRGPSPTALRNRRVAGALVFVAIAGLLVFVAVQVIGELNEDKAPPSKPKPLKTQELLVPEGLDRHQIADEARKAKLEGDYEHATQRFKGFAPGRYGAEDAPNLEGFLFPATYELPEKATVKDLVSRQLDAFEDNIAGVDLSYAKSKNLTVYDVLKIASMVEREVQVPKERPLVAEVIYNRLKAGNPLGIDATIRYEDRNYDEQLTESRLAADTPYNTRTHPGLPPTPIGNPGLDSIEAAANPAKGDLFYFVVKPGTCGEHFFTASEAAFERAQADYQQALAAEGGSPTDC